MPPTVKDSQVLYLAHIESLPCEVAEERMTYLCPFKHLYVLTVDFQFHPFRKLCFIFQVPDGQHRQVIALFGLTHKSVDGFSHSVDEGIWLGMSVDQ